MFQIKSKSTLLVRKSNGQFVKRNDLGSVGLLSQTNTKLSDLDEILSSTPDVNIGIGFDNQTHYSGLSYAQLALILERGTSDGRIPPRPYLQVSSQIASRKIKKQIRVALREMMLDSQPVTRTRIKDKMQAPANAAAEIVKRIIRNGPALGIPANRPSTLRQKAGSAPWVDKGDLINNLSGRVSVR